MRVAVTRVEDEHGPLASALRGRGLTPVPCPVLNEAPLDDDRPLRVAAAGLASYDWVVVASRRSVDALGAARSAPWPAGLRSAAVGAATASALTAAGATPPPVVAAAAGAAALWAMLAPLDTWPGRRVLVLTTPGGRTTLIDALGAAGAHVDVVNAYRLEPREAAHIREDWAHVAPDAVILSSPRAASTLVSAIGKDAITRLRAVVAIGETTAHRLVELGVAADVAPEASFGAAAAAVARRLETP